MENIIILIMDGVRIKNLSLYGYNKETDKNLKSLAKEGIIFTSHFSSSNSTAPAITSLFTAKFPNNHGIIHQFPHTTQKELEKFKKNKFWFPSYLKTKGYNTIGIFWFPGWFKKGFNFYGEKENKKNWVKKIMNSKKVKKILLKLPNWIYYLGKKIIKIRASPLFPFAKDTTNLAIKKIKTSKKPFLLYLHYLDTHFPFPTTKNPKVFGRNDVEKILKNINSKSQKEYIKKRFVDIKLNSLKDIENKYDLAIKNLDKEIGKLITFLKKERLWKKTLFVVLADHGENFGEHKIYFSHSGLYDESIHVPLIMKIPGFKNKKVEEIVQNIDIIPTLLEYLGEKNLPKDFDGKSMLNLLKTNTPIRKKALLFDGLAKNVVATRTKNKKLILSKNPKCNLCKTKHHKKIEEYDLKKDPNEEKNLINENSQEISLKKFSNIPLFYF